MLGSHLLSMYCTPDIHFVPIHTQNSRLGDIERTSKSYNLIPFLNPHYNIFDTWSFHLCVSISSTGKFSMSQANDRCNSRSADIAFIGFSSVF